MRGAADGEHSWPNRRRVIPACAGNGLASRIIRRSLRCQPCVCGERTRDASARCASPGPSRRVRGAGLRRACVQPEPRVIPARAGSRRAWSIPSASAPGHPCVCGERHTATSALEGSIGSSLRMRGADLAELQIIGTHRVIPAYAGSGVVPLPCWAAIPGHPCVCGEREPASAVVRCGQGSSLRMRGAEEFRCRGDITFRVIPAYAGSGLVDLVVHEASSSK